MSEININYKGSTIASMDSSGTKTLLTSGKYCEDNIAVVYTRPSAPVPALQTKSVAFTPAETIQTSSVTADAGYDGLSAVDISVGAISSTFVGSGIPRKSASDLTQNHQSITAPSGYYSANATFAMAQALGHLTASVDASGMVTATYDFLTAGYQASGGTAYSMQLTSLAASTYTPSATAQTIPSQRWLVGAQTIEAIPSAYIIPSGTSSITANGIYDITSFASVDISVSGVTPTGTYSVTSNGIYDITSYASVDVNVSGGGGDHSAEDALITKTLSGVYENNRITVIGSGVFSQLSDLTSASFENVERINHTAFYSCQNLKTINAPKASFVGQSAFETCSSLKTVILPSVGTVGYSAFKSCRSIEMLSFNKLSYISSAAFFGCTHLMSIYILRDGVATMQSYTAFNNTPMSNSSYTGAFGSIYVPANRLSSYITATNWSRYSSRITAYTG